VTAALADLHEQLKPFFSEIGRPSVDPELMIPMLIVGYWNALPLQAFNALHFSCQRTIAA
jgi:hypothetical protein